MTWTPNSYAVAEECILRAAQRILLHRAWKHREQPKGWTDALAEELAEIVAQEAMDELCEWGTFDQPR